MAQGKGPSTSPIIVGEKSGAEEEWYDLLPIETKLITYSLGLGVAFLVVFIFAFGVLK